MPAPKWIGVAAGICLPLLVPLSTAIGQSDGDAAEKARVQGVYEASADALEAMQAQTPLEQFDVKALAQVLAGKSPQEVSDWVGANITLVAYRGVLKGAQGTLEDQRGNSLDRALLLQAILAAHGVEARLARAALDDPAVDRLIAAIDGAPPPSTPSVPDDQAILEKYYADPRVDGAKARARNERERAEAAVQYQTANQRVALITARLQEQTAALASARAADEQSARRTALADHWWVQAGGEGAWIDLDPSAMVLGGAVSAAETFTTDQVPQDLRRTVTIRIVAEFARDGVLGRETLLSRDFDPAAVTGRLIVLRHRALNLKPMDAIFAEGGDFNANVIAEAAKSSAWAPGLAIGDEVFTDRLVATDGDVSEATEANMALHGGGGGEGAAGMGGAIGGTIGDLDDALSGEEPYDENTGPVKFTAEFIEIETRNPGEEPRLERRTLFDIIGPAARARRDASAALTDKAKASRGLAMLDNVEIMITAGRLSPARAAVRIQESYALAFRATAAWLAAGDGSAGPSFPDNFRHVNLPLNAFAAGRMTYGADGPSRFQAEPNAAMTRQGLRASDDGHGLVEVMTFDIVTNRVRGRDHTAGIEAGVADTVAEHIAADSPNPSRSTAVRYAAALEAGDVWALVEPGDSSALEALDLDPDSKAMVAEDLGRGYAVVVPQHIASLDDAVWWRIDPVTGETLGMNALGGAETVEYYVTLTISLGNAGACMWKMAQAGPNPSTGKQIGIATCLIGAVAGFSGALIGKLAAWQIGALAGVNGVIGGFADP